MHCRLLLLAALTVCAAGCSGGHSTAPVSGRVTLDDKPLPNAAITFQPVATEGNNNPGPGSGAFTDAEGRYTLKVIGLDTPGAIIGKHKVNITIKASDTDPSDDRPKKFKQLPAKYRGKETKLEFNVPPAGTDSADFQLKSK